MTPEQQILQAAAMALLVPGVWNVGADAVNVRHFVVPVASANACQWCARGALLCATFDLDFSSNDYRLAKQRVEKAVGNLVTFNDYSESPELVAEALWKASL